jgi:signal transduction histidine kinase
MAANAPRRWYALTVRARTTAAATLVVGLALLAGGIALAAVLQRSLVSDLDQVAELRATALAELAARGSLDPTIAADNDEAVQVVDARGHVVAASKNVHGRPPLVDLRPQDSAPVVATINAVIVVRGQFRVLALRSQTPTEPVTIYIATNLKHADQVLVLEHRSLFVGIPLLVALVAATTWATVGRALRPVEAIRSQVAEISRRDLGRRVPVSRAADEVSRLARTMNDMLGRLQETVDQQRRFVADASHELRTPLAAARTDLEVALLHPDSTPWTDTARALLEENQRMERLVADLLYLARADHEAPQLPKLPVDLHEVVLGEATRISTPNRMRIDTSGVTGAFVEGRRDDLARVVRNLLDNAERYACSVVEVALHTLDGTVTLTVDDDGPGILPHDRSRIFERFSRLEDSRSRSAGGTGLGLAIVKEIIENHHGNVTVSERAPHGARIVVTLPADES